MRAWHTHAVHRKPRGPSSAEFRRAADSYAPRIGTLVVVIAFLVAAFDRALPREPSATSTPLPAASPTVKAVAVVDASPVSEFGADAASPATRCLGLVNEVLGRAPQVRASFNEAARAAAAQGHGMGGFDDPPSDEGGYGTSWGVHAEERFERFGGYRISNDGTIDVDVFGEPVELPEGEREAIRRACAGVTFNE